MQLNVTVGISTANILVGAWIAAVLVDASLVVGAIVVANTFGTWNHISLNVALNVR